MQIGNYIILEEDTDLRRLRAGDGTHKFTVDGQVIITPGSIVPVIRSGVDCIGLAKVNAITMREDSTTIFFTMLSGANVNYKALYEAFETATWNGSNSGESVQGGNFGIPKAGKIRFSDKHRHSEDDDGPVGLTQDDIRRLYR